MKRKKYGTSNKFLLFGLVFILLGGLLLLRTTGYLPSAGRLWPSLLLVTGFIMLWGVWGRGAPEHYLLSGMMLTLAGTYFLLSTTVFSTVPFTRLWPILMGVLGLSLIPYGFTKEGNSRTALIVPGITITALAAVFLPFSLGLVKIRFRVFVLQWWPALFFILGIVLFLLYFRKSSEKGD